ncbi:helix-turn-helix transcriptional regulator [Methylobacterium sp. SD274]|uniref:helix-turn-helix domain-containing protein n=1 Tax=Methylobacterium sp. SD274 TaxID=2782009 RepID=UPI001A95CD4A|nr:helix-turn-helix transcriptional regulator [Methylobacterium sp. SD274]MBO1023004.1 helix-turn-helix transcriptional regulator [Methylobacterium sp. SD274]
MTVKSTTGVDRAVSLRIAALRKAKRLSQTELGQHVGVTFQQVQKYEKGANRVSSGRLQQIAQFLEVPMSTLFGDHEAEEQSDAFGFLSQAGAVDLLRAYASIEDDQLRRDVLRLVRTVVGLRTGQTKRVADLIQSVPTDDGPSSYS